MSVASQTIEFSDLLAAVDARGSEASIGTGQIYELFQKKLNGICMEEVSKRIPPELHDEAFRVLEARGHYYEIGAPAPGQCSHYFDEDCPVGCFEYDEDPYDHASEERYSDDEEDAEIDEDFDLESSTQPSTQPSTGDHIEDEDLYEMIPSSRALVVIPSHSEQPKGKSNMFANIFPNICTRIFGATLLQIILRTAALLASIQMIHLFMMPHIDPNGVIASVIDLVVNVILIAAILIPGMIILVPATIAAHQQNKVRQQKARAEMTARLRARNTPFARFEARLLGIQI